MDLKCEGHIPTHMETNTPKSVPKDPAIVPLKIMQYWKDNCVVGSRTCLASSQDLKNVAPIIQYSLANGIEAFPIEKEH